MTADDIRVTGSRSLIRYVWIVLGLDALIFLLYLFNAVATKTDAAGHATNQQFAFFFGLFLVLAALPLFISKRPAAPWVSGVMGIIPLLFALLQLSIHIKNTIQHQEPEPMQGKYFFAKGIQAALADSILKGDTSQIRALADKGLNLNSRGKQNMNLLEFTIEAASYNDNESIYKEALRILLEEGADPNLCLGKAVVYLSSDIFPLFLNKGGNPNGNGFHGEKVIFTAIRYGRLDNMRLLVEKGADMEVLDDAGRTPLLVMAQKQQWEGVTYLLEKGADFAYASPDGQTLMKTMAEYRDSQLQGEAQLPVSYRQAEKWLAERGVRLPVSKKAKR